MNHEVQMKSSTHSDSKNQGSHHDPRQTIAMKATISIAFSSPVSLRPPSLLCRGTAGANLPASRKQTCKTSTMSATTPGVNRARTAVITGATGGIGLETCKGLASTLPNLSQLILCCRDTTKAETVANSLREIRRNRSDGELHVEIVPVDLSQASSVVQCAEDIATSLGDTPLDLLICNAGIMACPLAFANKNTHESTTPNNSQRGVELQYFVNHISHAILTERLLPRLRTSENGRIIFVSSLAVAASRDRVSAPKLEEKFEDVLTAGNYSKFRAYGDSKLAMSLYASAVAERESGFVEAVSLHPGMVQTDLTRYLLPGWLAKLASASGGASWGNIAAKYLLGLKLPEEGAALTLQLALADRGAIRNGELYLNVRGKLASDGIIPLLGNREQVTQLYADTKSFVDAISSVISS